MKELPHTRSCFVCGESNPLGLNLRFQTDGEVVHGRFVPRAELVGFKGVVHGGLLATVLDEVMVWACAVKTKRFAFCAEFTVRFLRSISPGSEYTLTGRMTQDRRGRLFHTQGELRDESGHVCAAATGKYVPIRPEETVEMAEDFVGGPPVI